MSCFSYFKIIDDNTQLYITPIKVQACLPEFIDFNNVGQEYLYLEEMIKEARDSYFITIKLYVKTLFENMIRSLNDLYI